MIETVSKLNESLFWVINAPHGALMDNIMIVITFTGYTIPAIIIALLAMKFYGGLNKRNIYLLAIAILAGGVIVQGIKQTYAKDRPLGHFKEQSQELFNKVHAPYKQPHHRTFPSGHSQTGFGVAIFIILLFRKHKTAWIAWATLVALSRVVLGVHFPIDIIAGSLLGALASYATLTISGELKSKEIKT